MVARLFTITLIMSCLLRSVSFAQESDDAICNNRLKETVQRLNILYISHHIDPIVLNAGPYSYSVTYDPWRQLKVRRYWFEDNLEMQCIYGTNQVIDIIRTEIANRPIFLDHEPVPTWKTDQVISHTKPWVQAFLNYFPSDLGLPRTFFTSNMRDAKRFYHGEWSIRWPRVDLQGHPFELDSLAVVMSEDYGLIACRLNFDSTFQEFQGKTISSEDALAAAAAPAQTLLESRNLVGMHFPEGLKLGTPKAELFVANPNNIFQCKSMDQFAKKLNARLAWDVNYPLLDGDIPDKNHTIIIKIDAETKEVLGGDFR